jgi:hypothetical protein
VNMAPLLLTALQLQASAEGLVEVTVAQLARTLGSSERQVQRLLRLLETSGAITALCKAGGRGKPAQYRISTSGGRQGGDSSSPPGRGGQGVRTPRAVLPVTHSAPKSDAPGTLSAFKGDISTPKGDVPGTHSTPYGDPPVTLSNPKSDTLGTLSGQTTLFRPPLPPTPPYTPVSIPTTTSHSHAKAAEVYRGVGSEPPAPGVLNTWAKLLGGMDPLCTLLAELAAAGHLTTKGQAYVFGAVKNRAAGLSRPLAAAPVSGGPGTADPRRLAQAAALAGRRTGDDAA